MVGYWVSVFNAFEFLCFFFLFKLWSLCTFVHAVPLGVFRLSTFYLCTNSTDAIVSIEQWTLDIRINWENRIISVFMVVQLLVSFVSRFVVLCERHFLSLSLSLSFCLLFVGFCFVAFKWDSECKSKQTNWKIFRVLNRLLFEFWWMFHVCAYFSSCVTCHMLHSHVLMFSLCYHFGILNLHFYFRFIFE